MGVSAEDDGEFEAKEVALMEGGRETSPEVLKESEALGVTGIEGSGLGESEGEAE